MNELLKTTQRGLIKSLIIFLEKHITNRSFNAVKHLGGHDYQVSLPSLEINYVIKKTQNLSGESIPLIF